MPDLRRSSHALDFVSGFVDESVLRARPSSFLARVVLVSEFVDESVLRARPSSFEGSLSGLPSLVS